MRPFVVMLELEQITVSFLHQGVLDSRSLAAGLEALSLRQVSIVSHRRSHVVSLVPAFVQQRTDVPPRDATKPIMKKSSDLLNAILELA